MPDTPVGKDTAEILFNASTVMVGVCLTVIGILYLDPHLRRFVSVGDFLITVAAVMFLTSGILAYLAIRHQTRRQRLNSLSELTFFSGMCLIVFICIALGFLLF